VPVRFGFARVDWAFGSGRCRSPRFCGRGPAPERMLRTRRVRRPGLLRCSRQSGACYERERLQCHPRVTGERQSGNARLRWLACCESVACSCPVAKDMSNLAEYKPIARPSGPAREAQRGPAPPQGSYSNLELERTAPTASR
jgi:hypothetical protein